MDSLNKNLQSAYLTMQAATKESLVLIQYLSDTSFIITRRLDESRFIGTKQSQRGKKIKNSKKNQKGIDKIRIRFII